ncbi:MAG: hypothetical protein ACFFF4_02210 [Candidatus Thorarchaeota archaeon]
MQLLEITLTALATALPAILTAIVVIELLGITRITQRLNSLIRSMESPEALNNSINTVIGSEAKETPATKPSARRKKKATTPKKKEEEIEELEEEPEIVTSFDFGDEDTDESADDEKTTEAPEPASPEPMSFGERAPDDDAFSDFELEIDKDGTFELKDSDEEDDEE